MGNGSVGIVMMIDDPRHGEQSKSSDERWITYRGAVDAWECDQMQHMNIQHYARRVSLAERYFFAACGLSRSSLERSSLSVQTMQEGLRFAKELRVGSPIVGRSIPLCIDQNNELHIKHQLLNAQQGDVCLTSHTRYRLVDPEGSNAAWPETLADLTDRSRDVSQFEPPSSALVGAIALKECARLIVSQEECEGGEMTREALVRLANHACSHVGLEHGRQWNGGQLLVGSATLQLEMARHAQIAPETLLVVQSKIGAGAGKTVRTMHQVLRADDQQRVATIWTTNIFFDVSSRKALPIPTSVKDLLSQRVAPTSTD